MRAPYADFDSGASTPTATITNSAGFRLLMNPIFVA